MTEHKFTDEEVIKAMECCANPYCNRNDCPLYEHTINTNDCITKLSTNALDLINRQKAEIERLTTLAELGRMRANDYRAMRDKAKSARAEAIKEFLTTVLEKKDTASHYAPGAEVVTVEVLEHYARQFTEGSGESG